MLFGTLAQQVETLTHLLVRWHVKMRSWHAFGKLARKPHRHASTLVCKPCWHASKLADRPHRQAGTHGMQFSKLLQDKSDFLVLCNFTKYPSGTTVNQIINV